MYIENEIESFIRKSLIENWATYKKNILTNSSKELKGMINIINNEVIVRYRSDE